MNEYTQEEFERSYKKIYSSLIKDGISTQHHCVVFLGGQPGTGKSSLAEDDTFLNYISPFNLSECCTASDLSTIFGLA